MSDSVKLSAKLSKDDETNGLDHLAGELINNPDQVIAAIVWLDVSKVTHDVDKSTDVPTVRVRRIEPFGPIAKVPADVIKMAAELQEARTGKKALPFDVLEVDKDGGYVNPPEEV